MKKQQFIILVLLGIIGGGFISCSESDPLADSMKSKKFEVSIKSITLEGGKKSCEFYITAQNIEWFAETKNYWIDLDSYSGKSSKTVTFTVDDNDSGKDRYGVIEVYTYDPFYTYYTINVMQERYMDVSPSSINYDASGGYQYLDITAGSSQSWIISRNYSDSWIHFGYSSNSSTTYSGSGTNLVGIIVDKNTGTSSRKATLTVKFGSIKKEITITQDAAASVPAFEITSVKIANVDYEGSIINDYGTTIYSSQTKYLQPKIYIKVNRAGTYTVYTKLYKPSGELSQGTSSPSGYSFSNSITINSYTTFWVLSGWGNNNAGHWVAGDYRFEFYLDGVKIGEKSFSIY